MRTDPAREAQERDWIARLMAAAPAARFGEGAHLARGIVHPMGYQIATADHEDGPGWDTGWLALYRIMVMTVETWCEKHPGTARRATRKMTVEDMLWLGYKEKWGRMRWEIHASAQIPKGLTESVRQTAQVLESASGTMCQDCGRPSSVRTEWEGTEENGRRVGWTNSLCNGCHRTRSEESRRREEARWAREPVHRRRGKEAPPSQAESETYIETHLAELRPVQEDHDRWAYAEDVLKEWQIRSRGEQGVGRRLPPSSLCTCAAVREETETSPHTVRLGRWRYEEAVVEIDATGREEAAARARDAEVEWTSTEEASAAFVRGVRSEATPTVRTTLRIEEQHGETAALEATLAKRRNALREIASQGENGNGDAAALRARLRTIAEIAGDNG